MIARAPTYNCRVTPEDVARAAAHPENRLGKYILVSELGRGGMGVVWKAWQSDLQRLVALKFVRDVQDAKRFEREAQLAASLSHPNIAQIYEIGEIDGPTTAPGGGASEIGRRYIAMQYIDGKTLQDSRAQLTSKRTAEVMRDAARAIHEAHKHGIVHRDVKPQNLMLDHAGQVYVMDFGLARPVQAGSSLTMSGMMVGTPSYMPPEQAQAKERVDARADVYSLGATMYDLLAGQAPFPGENAMSVVLAVLNDDPKPLRRLNPRVHVDLETICHKAMEKAPERRYASALELADELQRYLDGEPIHATPATFMTAIARKIRKNRGVFIAGAVAVVIAGAAMGFILGGAASKRREVARLLKLGDDAFAARDWGHAKAFYDQALGLAPEQAPLRDKAALCQTELDAFVAAAERLRQREAARRTATEAFESGRKIFDDGILLLYKQGATFIEVRDQMQKADERFTEALRHFSDFPEALILRGRGRVEMLAFADAVADYDEAIRIAPELSVAYYWRGVMGFRRLRVEARAEMLGHWFKDPKKAGALQAAMTDLQKAALKLNEPDKVELAKGWSEMLQGEPRRVLSRVAPLIVRYPRSEEAHLLKSTALQALERNEESLAAIEEVRRLQPNCIDALLDRAGLYYRLNRFAEADAAYSDVIAFGGPFPSALMYRGLSRVRAGRLDEGFEDLRLAGEAEPGPGVIRVRALALGYLKRTDEALELIAQSLKDDPGSHDAVMNRSTILMEGGRYEAAIDDYTFLIRHYPEDGYLFYHRGLCRFNLGHHAECIHDMTAADRLTPQNSDILMTRGLSRWELGDAEGASRDLDDAIEAGPRNVFALVNRAAMRISRAQWQWALEDCDEALKVAPRDDGALSYRARCLVELGRDDDALNACNAALAVLPEEAQLYI